MTGLGFEDRTLTEKEWKGLVDQWLIEENPGKRVLLLPPDITRCYSYAGEISAYLYEKLKGEHEVFLMPAVGTHMQMNTEELNKFFKGIPEEAFLKHDWKNDNVCLGTIPSEVTEELTGNKCHWKIDVLLNHRLVSGEFDTIISIGQVVPHEVVGFANYTKNLLVGLGGRDMINRSHMVSAICNIETILGNIDSPVRAIFDYAQRNYLDRLGIHFFLTVTTEDRGKANLYGLYIGKERETFVAASELAKKKNVTYLPERVKRMVCYLDPEEFRSTWVGNKAIYRTRMAIADGGELIIIAPGLKQFGENQEVDACIRKYGYCGTDAIMKHYENGDFENLDMVAAHLVHGSTDGRFSVVYATDPNLLGREEVENAGYRWSNVRDVLEKYRPQEKETGMYTDSEGEFYFVKAPAVGLWRTE